MSSRKIEHLDPRLQPKAREFQILCAKEGIDILIYCTYRSSSEQEDRYAQGRTRPGPIVTYLRGGSSKHNRIDKNGNPAAMAFDAVPIRQGKAIWKDPNLWKRMGEIAEEIGLIWGGRWKKLKDYGHFEMAE